MLCLDTAELHNELYMFYFSDQPRRGNTTTASSVFPG